MKHIIHQFQFEIIRRGWISLFRLKKMFFWLGMFRNMMIGNTLASDKDTAQKSKICGQVVLYDIGLIKARFHEISRCIMYANYLRLCYLENHEAF